MRRGLLACAFAGAAGCWSQDLIDGELTPAQWNELRASFRRPAALDPCGLASLDPSSCAEAATLGQQLFFSPTLSGNGAVSCATCHDPAKWFIDPRSTNNVSESLGPTGWTKRNTPTLIDLVFKPRGAPLFTWTGKYNTAPDVLELAIVSAMGSTHVKVAAAIDATPAYLSSYQLVFPAAADPVADPDGAFANLKQVFGAYLYKLVGQDAPFDRYLGGDDSALDEHQQHGLAVFAGRGMCIECHSGSLLTDLEFHVTGVPQVGANVIASDPGRADVSMDAADAGAFLTPPLRNVAKTAPYMHDGALATLDDVVDFYRDGGARTGFAGHKDPRMVPFDLSDDDARDLVRFLEALTELPVDAALTRDIRVPAACGGEGPCAP